MVNREAVDVATPGVQRGEQRGTHETPQATQGLRESHDGASELLVGHVRHDDDAEIECERAEDEIGGVDDDDHREDDGLAAGVEQRLDGVDHHEEGESDQTAHHRPAVGGQLAERRRVQGRHQRDGTRDHENETDLLARHVEAAVGDAIGEDGGEQGVEGHLREREDGVEDDGEQHVALLEDGGVLGVLVVLEEQLLVRVDVVLRPLAQNAAQLALHLLLALPRGLHLLRGNGLLCEQHRRRHHHQEHEGRESEGEQERVRADYGDTISKRGKILGVR